MYSNIIHSKKPWCHNGLNQRNNLVYLNPVDILVIIYKKWNPFPHQELIWALCAPRNHVCHPCLLSQHYWALLCPWRHQVSPFTGPLCSLPEMSHFLTFPLSTPAHLSTSAWTSLPFKYNYQRLDLFKDTCLNVL